MQFGRPISTDDGEKTFGPITVTAVRGRKALLCGLRARTTFNVKLSASPNFDLCIDRANSYNKVNARARVQVTAFVGAARLLLDFEIWASGLVNLLFVS